MEVEYIMGNMEGLQLLYKTKSLRKDVTSSIHILISRNK